MRKRTIALVLTFGFCLVAVCLYGTLVGRSTSDENLADDAGATTSVGSRTEISASTTTVIEASQGLSAPEQTAKTPVAEPVPTTNTGAIEPVDAQQSAESGTGTPNTVSKAKNTQTSVGPTNDGSPTQTLSPNSVLVDNGVFDINGKKVDVETGDPFPCAKHKDGIAWIRFWYIFQNGKVETFYRGAIPGESGYMYYGQDENGKRLPRVIAVDTALDPIITYCTYVRFEQGA